ncbi:MAG: TRAP transporter small permease [Rhodospirillales bacterium]|nr:TRAP transporter small permease [Rhodospirillales bacterium]
MFEKSTPRTLAMNILKDVDLYIAMVAFVFIVLVTFLFVITRYFYSMSLPGLEEFTVIIFIWFLYFSMMYCMRKNSHIRVNVIDLMLPPKGRTLVSIFANLILLIFNVGMIFCSARLVYFNLGPFGATSIILGIPDYVVYAILPLSFSIFSVSVIAQVWREVHTLKTPGKPPARGAIDVEMEGSIDAASDAGKD